ncbi:hypothetical protein D3C87_2102630 [compost metagenome]
MPARTDAASIIAGMRKSIPATTAASNSAHKVMLTPAMRRSNVARISGCVSRALSE